MNDRSSSFRNAELVALQKARAEAEGAREHSCPGFQDRDLSRALREKTGHLSEIVQKLAERMDTVLAGVEQARQEVQSTCSVPGAAMEAEWRSADNSYKKLRKLRQSIFMNSIKIDWRSLRGNQKSLQDCAKFEFS